jgi:hypothetical protein
MCRLPSYRRPVKIRLRVGTRKRHGLFTKHLLDMLFGTVDNNRHGNVHTRITLSKIKGYLNCEMTYAVRRQFKRDQQEAVIGDPERDDSNSKQIVCSKRLSPCDDFLQINPVVSAFQKGILPYSVLQDPG